MSSAQPWLDREQIARALAEDLGRGDATTLACVPAAALAAGRIFTRQAGVIAGLPIVAEVFRQVDERITCTLAVAEGATVAPDATLTTISGPAQGILIGERVALNYLGRLSGIATLTARCVAATNGTAAHIIDTRKTTPGLRAQEKYAVRLGGGHNHRFGLDDGILIKDNHIVASGSVTQAIANARAHAHHLLRIEVECDTLEQVREALAAQAESILLDNMPPDQLRAAVTLIRAERPATIIEASGGIGTDPVKIHAVAAMGVDLISIGALTHSVSNLDLSLEFSATG
jgi:nicotinate-nucleotide pyrophosphorylase (carboxylating)